MKKTLEMIVLSAILVFTMIQSNKVNNNNEGHICLEEEGIYIVDTVKDANSDNTDLIRRKELEVDNNVFVYDMGDGNNIAYIYEHPVKYEENGETKDIDISIKPNQDRNNYAYASRENEFKVYYAGSIDTNGNTVLAVWDSYSIGIKPYEVYSKEKNSKNRIAVTSNNRDDNSITYSDVFCEGATLKYNTTYTGYKEIIEIPYNCSSEYSFILDVGNLIPEVCDDGKVQLIDNETKECVGKFERIFVYDSSEIPLYTENSYYEINELDDGIYQLTLNVDEAFLNRRDITYPVVIDPTFSFEGLSGVWDAPVYSGKPNVACGANYYNHIGYVDSGYGIGSLLVSFPMLKNAVFFNGLEPQRITDVTYHARKVDGRNMAVSMGVYEYTGSAWSESTVTYNSSNLVGNTGNRISTTSVTGDGWYEFDITAVAKKWVAGTSNYDSGVLIKNLTNNNNSNYDIALASMEYGKNVNSAYKPYVTVVFNNSGTSDGYASAELAAKNFASSVYPETEYILFEYSATIYKYNGEYYYYNIVRGTPHSVSVSRTVPSGTQFVGVIHTHPNQEGFSGTDIEVFESLNGLGFVVTPSHSVMKYNPNTNEVSTEYTNVFMYDLDYTEKNALKIDLRAEWYSHFASGGVCSAYNCSTRDWPNE